MPEINITVQLTNNENIVKFVANSFLTQAKSYEFTSIDAAKQSPIAQELFYLPFVKTIYISQNFIAIEKFSTDLTQIKWEDVQNEVAETIEKYLSAGKPVIEVPVENEKNPITIYAESTPNPGVMKFVANKKLVEQIFEYKTIDETTHAPLAQKLFHFPFVKEVFMDTNYISITKFDVSEWDEIVLEIREFLRSYLEEGNEIMIPVQEEAVEKNSESSSEPLDEISRQIVGIIEEYIKPAVAADGGNILFDSYNTDDKSVQVILQGACSGCPSSTFTLKSGIENMLKEMLPGKVSTVNAING